MFTPVEATYPDTARAIPKSEITALPSEWMRMLSGFRSRWTTPCRCAKSSPRATSAAMARMSRSASRSEEHTSELQSLAYLVCRLLLEKKKTRRQHDFSHHVIVSRVCADLLCPNDKSSVAAISK